MPTTARALAPADGAGVPTLRVLGRAGLILGLAARTLSRRRPSDPAARSREAAASLSRVARALLDGHGVRLTVDGEPPRGPAILASNHVGYLDPLLIAAATPCLAIAKSDVASWPVFGWGAQSLGVLFAHRGDRGAGAGSLRALRRALEHGVSVINFCEGTTTRGDRVLPFRPGVFGLARKMNVPVIPVCVQLEDPALAWVGDDTFVPHYLRFAARAGTAARVTFCPAVPPRAAASARELAEVARSAVAAAARIRENT